MATFSLGIGVTLSSDKKYITIANEGTVWGSDILSPADFTSLTATVKGEDKDATLYTIVFTQIEINNFLTGIDIYFSDSRWFNETYADDNYYVVYLTANTAYDSDWEAFEMHLGLEEQVHINNATVNLRPQNLFELENNLQAVVGLDTMTNLSNDKYSADREYKWRELYKYIRDNVVNKY